MPRQYALFKKEGDYMSAYIGGFITDSNSDKWYDIFCIVSANVPYTTWRIHFKLN